MAGRIGVKSRAPCGNMQGCSIGVSRLGPSSRIRNGVSAAAGCANVTFKGPVVIASGAILGNELTVGGELREIVTVRARGASNWAEFSATRASAIRSGGTRKSWLLKSLGAGYPPRSPKPRTYKPAALDAAALPAGR